MGILSSRDGYLHAQGLKLALSSFGDPAAPLVIFAHGGGQTRHAWSGAAKTVAFEGYPSHVASTQLI